MRFKLLSKDKISQLPKTPGVYSFKKGREFLYIGKAADIRERVKNHFRQPGYKENSFINQVEKIGYIKTDSEFVEPSARLTSHPASPGSTIEALILEAKLIKKYQPKYNVMWRDDKNYFYVGITKEDFPRIFWTHQPKKRKAIYVGPFVDGKALKQTLKVLRKVFPYRSCKKLLTRKAGTRPCLWYHLNRCPAPCLIFSKTGQELPEFSQQIKKECQKNTKNILNILKGKKGQVLKDLKKEMKKASQKQNFEKAALKRDQIRALERVLAHSRIFGPQPVKVESWSKTQRELEKILKTKKKISRIEAYDVSNLQGKEATGSMVTFIKGIAEKDLYRRFKIKIEGKPNDTAMIKEVLKRRFKHPEWGLPDLVLIDGGKGQLNAAIDSKSQASNFEKIKVLAIAKEENKLFIETQRKPILLKSLPREIFNLILQLRDEAHRFALSYHRKLRHKRLLK
jgi:excinuclease ABC subunit C